MTLEPLDAKLDANRRGAWASTSLSPDTRSRSASKAVLTDCLSYDATLAKFRS